MITGVILFTLILIVQIALAFVPSSGKLVDNRKYGWKRYTSKGKAFITLSIISVGLLLTQYIIQEIQKNVTEIKSLKENQKKDSLYDLKLKERTDELVATISNELGRYQLRLDTANKRIINLIKDSVKKSIINKYGDPPSISVCSNNGISVLQKSIDTILYRFELCYKNYPSNVNLTVFVYAKDINSLLYYKDKVKILNPYLNFASGVSVGTQYYYLPKKIDEYMLYFHLKGAYSDRTNKYKDSINEIYHFNLKTNIWGQPSDIQIVNIVKEQTYKYE